MEKQSRINKYKQLREEMKEEVNIDRRSVSLEEDVDDDFLDFLSTSKTRKKDDTLIEPLSYETLEKDNEYVQSALNDAKVNLGKEQYDTRLDILNKIKNDTPMHQPTHAKGEDIKQRSLRQTPKALQSEHHETSKQPQKKMTLLEKLAAMSEEKNDEYGDMEKTKNDMSVAELMRKKTKSSHSTYTQKSSKPQKKVYQSSKVEEFDGEEESKVVTILNYVAVAFVVLFGVIAIFLLLNI